MKWLRRYLLSEAIFQLFQGAMFAVFGLFVVALTSYVSIFVIAFILFEIDSVFSMATIGTRVFNAIMIGGVFFVVLGLSFRGAYKNKWGMDYSGERISLSSPISANIGRGLVNIICEILFSGPSLLFTSIECVWKFLRLSRLLRKDLLEVAGLFLWLFDKGRKATVEEISAELLGSDTIRILPQMRDIPGVIWLTYHHGVIILSSELRNRLAATLNQGLPFRSPEFEPEVEDEPSSSQDYSGSAEAVDWYKALNLPPFAPLATVKRRYRQMAKIYHPDTAAGRKTDASEVSDAQFKRINSAYHSIIKNSKSAGT